ncbi:abortive infection family protein [Vibrio variabilis]|uniref:abortive infection family protein n=1 Tax=Vibrio variabilis TaxID=990271 RepID=UPI000DDC177B|nr:abortive infection family protein [Vibrio variabilis]
MNKLERLKSIATKLNDKHHVVASKLNEFEAELIVNLPNIEVYGRSKTVTLEHTSDEDWTYGYIYYSKSALKVAYRSTFDDYVDARENTPNAQRVFSTQSIHEMSNQWKVALIKDEILDSLITSIETNLSADLDSAERATASLVNLFNVEVEHIDRQVKDTLIRSESLLKQWVKAKASVYTDPAESITRSSSYLESVCRQVIESNGSPLPNRIDITNLINAALQEVDLSSYPEESADVKKLTSGVKSMFSAIGAIRTHIGNAHGSSEADLEPDEDLAMLVNNSAAAVSLYLLGKSKT